MNGWSPARYPAGSFGRFGRADLFARDLASPLRGPSALDVLQRGVGGAVVVEVAYGDGVTDSERATGQLIDPYGDFDPYYQVTAAHTRALEAGVWTALICQDPTENEAWPVAVASVAEKDVARYLIEGYTTVLVDHEEITAWLERADEAIAAGDPARAVVAGDRYEVAAQLLTAAINADPDPGT